AARHHREGQQPQARPRPGRVAATQPRLLVRVRGPVRLGGRPLRPVRLRRRPHRPRLRPPHLPLPPRLTRPSPVSAPLTTPTCAAYVDLQVSLSLMTRITVDVSDEWIETARQVLATDSDEATINAALHAIALRHKAAELMAILDTVEIDCSGSERAWRYGGGRDLSRLVEDARLPPTEAPPDR